MALHTLLLVSILIKLSFCQILFVHNSNDLEVGSPCKTKDNSDGTCAYLRTCEWARSQFSSGQITPGDFISCGFDRNDKKKCCKKGRVVWPVKL